MDFVLEIDIQWEARSKIQNNIYFPEKEHNGRYGRGVLLMPVGMRIHNLSPLLIRAPSSIVQLNINLQFEFIKGKVQNSRYLLF